MSLVKQFTTPFGVIRITRRGNGDLAYWQNGSCHSQADRRGISICTYVHVIGEIVRQARARRVLVIGCAGGTLPTLLRRQGKRVTVVDINPLAFVIARRYFGLPPDVRCVCRDGIAFLRWAQRSYDAVIVDVFGAYNNVPPPFTTKAFFQAVGAALAPGGVMVMNVIAADDDDRQADIIAEKAQNAGIGPVALWDWPGQTQRNTLIMGGAELRPRIHSGREREEIVADLHGLVRRRLRKTPRFAKA